MEYNTAIRLRLRATAENAANYNTFKGVQDIIIIQNSGVSIRTTRYKYNTGTPEDIFNVSRRMRFRQK